MENKNNEKKNKKIDEFKACLVESGVNTDGLDIKPDDSLWDIFMKLGVGKIVVCDDARTFDSSDMDRMREEDRVIGEMRTSIRVNAAILMVMYSYDLNPSPILSHTNAMVSADGR